MICSYAAVDKDKLESLKNLENELGQTLLAFNCNEIKPARLSVQQNVTIIEHFIIAALRAKGI